jgi:hypothetical protein
MDKIKTLKTSELSLNSSKVISLSDKQIALFNLWRRILRTR